MIQKQKAEQLVDTAYQLGATHCTIIPTTNIQVKKSLAALCHGEYICPGYGLSPGCPPHVKGPEEFRKWQAQSRYAVIVKIELDTSVMLSEQRNDVMRLLHNLVAGIEKKAIELGFDRSRAFSGGSCKKIFCSDQKECCVLAKKETCPHEESARPSMSGYGIDVYALMVSSGWMSKKEAHPRVSVNESFSWVAGLVLLA
jgi:predicted metal-binding protein